MPANRKHSVSDRFGRSYFGGKGKSEQSVQSY